MSAIGVIEYREKYPGQPWGAGAIAGLAGTEHAVNAARAGDVEALDLHEIAWLNAWGPEPIPPEGVPHELLDDWRHDLTALRILHGGDETQILWGYVEIGGSRDEAIWTFRTNMDLRVVRRGL